MRGHASWVGAIALTISLGAVACSDDEGAEDDGGGDAGVATSDGSGTTATAVRSGGELSMLTYNVAGLPQEISTVNPEDHLPLISPLLNDYDIVMTQEDFDFWVDDLAQLDFVNYHERLRAEATHEFRTEQHPGI